MTLKSSKKKLFVVQAFGLGLLCLMMGAQEAGATDYLLKPGSVCEQTWGRFPNDDWTCEKYAHSYVQILPASVVQEKINSLSDSLSSSISSVSTTLTTQIDQKNKDLSTTLTQQVDAKLNKYTSDNTEKLLNAIAALPANVASSPQVMEALKLKLKEELKKELMRQMKDEIKAEILQELK